jgi:hypothetical protein
MKTLALAVGMFALFIAGSAHAQPYGMAGCGLGSIAFGNDQTMFKQVLAATTNGTFGTQTFGITSGTSNCVSGGVIKAEREQAAFAEVNFQDLKANMAAGGGEYLASFATLLGCEDSAKPTFARMAQDKIETLVPSTSTTPIQTLMSVKQQIKASPSLAASCTDERAIARAEGTSSMTLAKR